MKSRAVNYTTRETVHQTCPKHLRSLPGSKVHPRSARAKAVQNVRRGHPWWPDMTRAFSRASKLFRTIRAASQSIPIPGRDTTRLKPTACASLRPNHVPTAAVCASNKEGREAAQRAAHNGSHIPRDHVRSLRTLLPR